MFAQWQVKEANSSGTVTPFWLLIVLNWRYMSQRWSERKSQLEGVSGPNVFMASQTAPVSPFVVSFLIWIKYFLTFCPGHAPSHTKPVSNSRKTNRNRKEKVNVAHFQAVEASWSSLNLPGAIIGSFQYRPISHSSLHSCLNMSLLNKDQFNNRGANFTKNRLFSHLKTNDSHLQTCGPSTDSIMKQQFLFFCSPNFLHFP